MTTQVQAEERVSNWKELDTTLDPELVRNVIAHENRNWGYSLLVLGFVQLVASNFLDPVWGIVLILIAAISFYFRSGAMLPVYGTTLAWAMVCNVLSGEAQWVILGLLQAYWAFTTFRQFLTLRRVTSRLGIGLGADAPVRPDRAASIFPWAGCALSAVSLFGLVALIVVLVVSYVLIEQEPSEQAVYLAYAVIMDSACLGLALGLAALLARFHRRLVSILAVLGGGLMLSFFLVLTLFS